MWCGRREGSKGVIDIAVVARVAGKGTTCINPTRKWERGLGNRAYQCHSREWPKTHMSQLYIDMALSELRANMQSITSS
jgi:hypothetical protein